MKKILLSVPDDLHSGTVEYSQLHEISVSEVMRMALRQLLNENPGNVRPPEHINVEVSLPEKTRRERVPKTDVPAIVTTLESTQVERLSPTKDEVNPQKEPAPTDSAAFGKCQTHRDSKDYNLVKISYFDENGDEMVSNMFACPKCIGKIKARGVGRIEYK